MIIDAFEIDLRTSLEEAAKDTGTDLRHSAEDLAQFVIERSSKLAVLVGLTGYDRAFEAERRAVALFAGIEAIDTADALDQRVLGILFSSLRFGVLALSGAA